MIKKIEDLWLANKFYYTVISFSNRRIKCSFLLIVISFLGNTSILAQSGQSESKPVYISKILKPSDTRGAYVAAIDNENIIKKEGKYYAILIADQDYNDKSIGSLSFPISDLNTLASTLHADYVFDSIKLMQNATRNNIIQTIYTYRKNLNAQDNLLIFYSGHGYWDTGSQQGYWLPVDADLNNPSTWISNSDIKDAIKAIKCGHTLLVSDACFAGGIFKTRDAGIDNASKTIRELNKTKSRKAMTSGTLTEVPDKSVFLKYMVEAMKNNKEAYCSSEKLFISFKENAINNSLMEGLIPQFGVIADTDDQGGDFIFIKK